MKTVEQYWKIQPDDDHMTWEEFVRDVEDGSLIDYDGFAELATADMVSDIVVNPSDVRDFQRPTWATHVVWYNR